MDAIHEKAAKHWNNRAISITPAAITRWWQSPQIVSHINRIICGERLPGVVAGDIRRLRDFRPQGFKRALSIGCGEGRKEIDLLLSNVVDVFDLFEIAGQRVSKGKGILRSHGLQERATFYEELVQFGAHGPRNRYDLIYWNNSLHHMLDVDSAIAWCAHSLTPDGVLYINDFVGPNRMQWPDDMLVASTRVRSLLDERFLRNPRDLSKMLPKQLRRPNIQRIIDDDPTECADSEEIIPAVNRYFSNVTAIMTGGAIYHLALNEVLANFEESDGALLEALLFLDETLAREGVTQYAVLSATTKRNG